MTVQTDLIMENWIVLSWSFFAEVSFGGDERRTDKASKFYATQKAVVLNLEAYVVPVVNICRYAGISRSVRLLPAGQLPPPYRCRGSS